jgi:hypothetical protein
MAEDLIRYEALVLDALRGVVRAVLQRVLKRGIPGEHHFFITFDTKAPGVGLSKRLKDQYPHEMTIVLQHQFWDLAVTEDRFEVRLSFNNVPERLVIPFSAVRIFQDPTVHFALALRPPEGDEKIWRFFRLPSPERWHPCFLRARTAKTGRWRLPYNRRVRKPRSRNGAPPR